VSFDAFIELGPDRFGGFGVVRRKLLKVGNDVTDRAQARKIFVWDLHAVFVLGLHRDLHHRQRVDVQVVDEGLLDRDLGWFDPVTSSMISAIPAMSSSCVMAT
jgi:hypothetical protein